MIQLKQNNLIVNRMLLKQDLLFINFWNLDFSQQSFLFILL